MIDYIFICLRRLKWDIIYYSRYMWRDIVLCSIIIISGITIGIIVVSNTAVIKECIFIKIINGTYSPIGTFIKIMLYSMITLTLINFTGFFKLYHLAHYIIVMYWGYRMGSDIIAITTVFVGYISLIFIYIPYYLASLFIYVSMILYIRLNIPSPRPNWWCYSRCAFNNCFMRSLYFMIPLSIINVAIFIINPLIFEIFTIVI